MTASSEGAPSARPAAVHVVKVLSPSYTGTTWLNLVLGGHARAFTIGPPERVWQLREVGFDDACRVHAAECPFWPRFFHAYRPGENFYLQLAAFSGCDFLVINNPSPAHEATELDHPDLIVHEIRMVRDGRALTASFARHHETDFADAIQRFARPLYRTYEIDFEREDVLCLRYEDLMADREGWLRRFSAYLGLDYGLDAFEFHKFEHHVTAGNHATISQLKALQGLPGARFRDAGFYESQLERMDASGVEQFRDERWKQEVGDRERFLFDFYCGAGNAAWGYEEDRFSSRQREEFEVDLALERRPRLAEARKRLAAGARRVRDLAEGALVVVAGERARRFFVLAGVVSLAWLITIAIAFLAGWWLG